MGNSDFSLNNTINKLIGILAQQKTGEYKASLWFLSCLFVTENIFYWIVKIANKYTRNLILVISLCIYLAGACYIQWVGVTLPWSIDTSVIAILFFSVGYLLKNRKEFLDKFNGKWSVVFFIINIITAFVNYTISGCSIDLNMCILGNPILFPIAAFSAIFGLMLLFKNVKNLKVIKYIGKNSLIFYGFSGITSVVPDIILYNILKANFGVLGDIGVIFSILYAIVQCVVTVPIVQIINTRIRFLLGDFSRIKGKRYE